MGGMQLAEMYEGEHGKCYGQDDERNGRVKYASHDQVTHDQHDERYQADLSPEHIFVAR